ncbi:hypothetical protein HPB52_003366 [Rhipicephalus sanguineus]|uniref:BTB domain-containing protein n=1 Tax=Rhipicephalus sanguineus TaxID=34632 RepID=A0A9D4T6Q9_RHISA|nr:hypothetical protein HPB52_003366 [Rhipicephalus sanguineus]
MAHRDKCTTDHEQQFDNSSTVLEKIAGLYAERLLSDITLEVGGKQYAAHRLILCASSDVFQVMLMDPKWSSSRTSHIELKEEPLCENVFGDFLGYLYTGRMRVDHLRVLPLVALADKYNVKDLMRLCISYMAHHIVSAAYHNQLEPWPQCARPGNEEAFGQLVSQVMAHVRFPMLTLDELDGLLSHPLVVRFQSIFFDRLVIALDFQTRARTNGFWRQWPELMVPRIYTSDTWSASLCIDNYPCRTRFGVHTLIFMTPGSLSGALADKLLEWTVDVYPKGVLFHRFLLIALRETLEGPESQTKTVRLSLTSSRFNEDTTVVVSILVSGMQDGVEHVRTVVQREHTFTQESRMLNLDDLVPYAELNDVPRGASPFLVGPHCDLFRLRISITPLCRKS